MQYIIFISFFPVRSIYFKSSPETSNVAIMGRVVIDQTHSACSGQLRCAVTCTLTTFCAGYRFDRLTGLCLLQSRNDDQGNAQQLHHVMLRRKRGQWTQYWKIQTGDWVHKSRAATSATWNYKFRFCLFMYLLRDKRFCLIEEQTMWLYWATSMLRDKQLDLDGGQMIWPYLGDKQLDLIEEQTVWPFWGTNSLTFLKYKQLNLIEGPTSWPYWGTNGLTLLWLGDKLFVPQS